MNKMLLLGAAVLLSACNASPPAVPADTKAPAASETPAAPAAPMPGTPAKPISKADFADKVWKVSASNGVQTGSTYTFLWNGTLVVDAPAGTPMYGRWSYDGGKLTMTEEGQAYPTDIVHLDANSFRIRSHNPGEAVDITLVPAPGVPLPPAAPPASETQEPQAPESQAPPQTD